MHGLHDEEIGKGGALPPVPSGLHPVGPLSWGSHFCQFYETAEDLRSTLVPFFLAGLDNNEQCIWVTADPFREEDARAALRSARPDIDALESSGRIEIVDHRRWYRSAKGLSAERAIAFWLEREGAALRSGYRGLRVTGNTSFLAGHEWPAFADYERQVQHVLRGRRIVALCSYCLAHFHGRDVLDVVGSHAFAIARSNGAWRVVESAALAAAREELARANVELEQRVTSRTRELDSALEAVRESERQSRSILEALPAAVYMTDAAGRITSYNQAAVAISGRQPAIGKDQWCVSWRLYEPGGSPVPHDCCPMAVALKENRPVRGVELVAERPDGTRVPILPYPTPLSDAGGRLTGAVNMLVDISERKAAETTQRMLLSELNHRVKNNLQMLYSLLELSARETRSPEARGVLCDASQRVAAMGAAQSLLYASEDAATLDGASFIEAVCASASRSFGENVAIELRSSPLELPSDVAMPLALIVNELVTNAAKHGADPHGNVRVGVELSRRPEGLALVVEDTGQGFDLDPSCKRSSGLGLVKGLLRQIKATFRVERTPGARCVVEFPCR